MGAVSRSTLKVTGVCALPSNIGKTRYDGLVKFESRFQSVIAFENDGKVLHSAKLAKGYGIIVLATECRETERVGKEWGVVIQH